MSFIDNLKTKIRLDKLMKRISATMRETPGQRNVNKDAVRELLAMTDFEHVKARDLHLYVRSLQEGHQEVLVLDNELPIYRSSVEDVAMRKTPHWKEMFSITNIKRILNDQNVIICKGKESLKRIYRDALDHLDLSRTEEDMRQMADDARQALEQRSIPRVDEFLELFFQLLGFEPIDLGVLEQDFQTYARPRPEEEVEDGLFYQDLVLFNEEHLQLRMLKGRFSPDSDIYLVRVLQCARGERPADLDGAEIFDYLGELALRSNHMVMEEHGTALLV